MEFVIWAARVVHILSGSVLIGGMVYYNAVLTPVAEYEKAVNHAWLRAVDRRFQGYLWSTVWPLFVTGIILLLLQPGLARVGPTDLWTWMMGAKVLSFCCLVFFGWQAGLVVERMQETRGTDDEAFDDWRRAYQKLMKRSIACGIGAILATGAIGIL
jgi:uncharacterized membrane protein